MFPELRIVCLILVLCGFVAIHLLIGGTRLLYAIPGYGAIAAAAMLSVFAIRRSTSPPQRWALVSALAFFSYVALRATTSPVAYLAWPDLFASLACLAVYLLFACHLTKPGFRLTWVAMLAMLAVAGVLIGALQFRDGLDWMPFGFGRPEDYRGRASGFFICPNHLAGFLEVTGLFALAIAFWSRFKVIWRLVAAYITLVCLAGILLSGSRGGFISFVAGLAVLGALTLIRLRVVLRVSVLRPILAAVAVILLASATVVIAVKQSSLLQNRAKLIFDVTDVRPRLWVAATEQARISPVVGTGAGTYLYFGRKFRQPNVDRDPIHVHNDYLELLAEFGIVGAGLALFFVVAHLSGGARGFRALCQRGEIHPRGLSNAAALNIGALASVAAYLVHSCVDFNLHIPENALLLAAVGGILANPSIDTDERALRASGTRSRRFTPRIILVVIGMILAGVTLPKLVGEWYAERTRFALSDRELLEASRLAREGIEHQTRNPYLYFYLGEANWDQARKLKNPVIGRSFAEAAVAAYQDSLKVFPQDSRTLLQAGWVMARLGRYDEAGLMFDHAVAWDPRNAMIRIYQGHFLRLKGDNAAAAEAYRTALAMGPNAEAEKSLREIEASPR